MFFEIAFIQLNMYASLYWIIASYHKIQMQISSTFHTSHLTARTMARIWTAFSFFHYYHKVDHKLNYVATWLVGMR